MNIRDFVLKVQADAYTDALKEILDGPSDLAGRVSIRRIGGSKFVFVDDVLLPFHVPLPEGGWECLDDSIADEYFQREVIRPGTKTLGALEIWRIPIYVCNHSS